MSLVLELRYRLCRIPNPAPWAGFLPQAISPSGEYLVGSTMNKLRREPHWSLTLLQEPFAKSRFRYLSEECYLLPAAVSNNGEVVGRTISRAFHTTVEKTGYEYLFPEDKRSYAVAIDASGNIYGTYQSLEGEGPWYPYCRTPQGEVIELDTDPGYDSYVVAVSQNGQVVVERRTRDYRRKQIIVYENGFRRELPLPIPLRGTTKADDERHEYRVRGINNHGDIVGVCEVGLVGKGSDRYIPVLWRRGGEPERLPTPEGKSASATGINDHGDIIGYIREEQETPFLIHQGTLFWLNDLVPSGKTPVVYALQILNNGTILAQVRVKGYDPFSMHPKSIRLKEHRRTVLLQPA